MVRQIRRSALEIARPKLASECSARSKRGAYNFFENRSITTLDILRGKDQCHFTAAHEPR